MAAVNRFDARASAVTFRLAACTLAAGLALTGCGAGQVAQTTSQQAAINGTGADVGQIALRNVYLHAPQTGDYIEPGSSVQLIFAAANGSTDTDDKLLSISSDIGAITISGDTTVPAAGLLLVGSPDEQVDPESVERADVAEAEVALTKPISNGLTYEFTFTFDKAGETKFQVPISAGETPRRDGEPNAGHHPSGQH